MKSRNLIIGTGALIAIGLLASAFSLKTKRTIPEGAHAVTPFDADKYLGTWYEIARFDFKFEKGLSKTTANYSLNDDGSIHVINRGYDAKKGKWKESVGKAVFVEEPDVAMLKVSFFGPFYSGYNVAALDPDYKYALVIGRNLDYMWLLSREKTMPEKVKDKYLEIAKGIGYDISRLMWVEQ